MIEERIERCASAMSDTPLPEVKELKSRLVIHEGRAALPAAEPTPRLEEIVPHLVEIELDIELFDGADEDRIDGAEVGAALYEGTNASFLFDDEVDLVWVGAELSDPFTETRRTTVNVSATMPSGDDLRLGAGSEFEAWVRQSDSLPRYAPFFMRCDPGGPTYRTRVVLERGELVLELRGNAGDDVNGIAPEWLFVRAEVRIDDIDAVEDDHAALLFSFHAWDGSDGTYGVVPPGGLGALGCGVVVGGLGTDEQHAALVDCELQEIEALAIVAVEREMI